MPVDEEREDFERAVAAFAKQDIPLAGHRAAHLSATRLTAELMAEYGLLYDSSLTELEGQLIYLFRSLLTVTFFDTFRPRRGPHAKASAA